VSLYASQQGCGWRYPEQFADLRAGDGRAVRGKVPAVKKPQPMLALLLICFAVSYAKANQILLRYVTGGSPLALTADKSGALFTVSSVGAAAGNTLTRVNKLDSSGNPLASIDLGFSSQTAAAATDGEGNLVIVGTTFSTGFPLYTPRSGSLADISGFVVKIDSQLQTVLFSKLLGAQSYANAVTVDASGNIFIAGSASSMFPITPGAYHTQATGAFVMELSADGSKLLFSTQFGGSKFGCSGGSHCIGASASTSASAIAVDPSGAIVFAGKTTALDLPVTPGVLAPNCQCSVDTGSGFIAKLAPGGGQLAWATYLNSTAAFEYESVGIDWLALGSNGDVLIAGSAPGIQTTSGAVQTAFPPAVQFIGFIARLDSGATRLIWSTYMGGDLEGKGLLARVSAIAVNAAGQIAFTGYADAVTLPSFPGVVNFGNTYAGWLSADGTALEQLYDGPDNSSGQALALTPSGNLVTAGRSGSLWIENSSAGPSMLGSANAASGLVSGVVAPYEIISVYGTGLGPQAPLDGQISNDVFTTMLGGYSVDFDGVPAPLLYIGPSQINAIVPSEVAGKNSTHLQLVTPSETVDGPTFGLSLAQPDIFMNSATGLSAALNQDGTLNSPQNPAAPGSIVTIFATGGEPANRPDGYIVASSFGSGGPANSMASVSILAGLSGNSLEVEYAGDAPGLVVGMMQVNFRLPASLGPFKTFSFQLQVGATPGGASAIAVAP
jgi:uncharacterized protein (TIGR03437 family)